MQEQTPAWMSQVTLLEIRERAVSLVQCHCSTRVYYETKQASGMMMNRSCAISFFLTASCTACIRFTAHAKCASVSFYFQRLDVKSAQRPCPSPPLGPAPCIHGALDQLASEARAHSPTRMPSSLFVPRHAPVWSRHPHTLLQHRHTQSRAQQPLCQILLTQAAP